MWIFIYYEGQYFNLLCIYLDICLHLSVVLNDQRLNIKARMYLIMEWLIHVLECISLLYYIQMSKTSVQFIDWLKCGDCITSISQIIKSCLGVFHPSVLVHLHSFSWDIPNKPPIIYTVFGAVEETANVSELKLFTIHFLR